MTDFAKDIQERFDFAAYHIMSKWEHEPDGMIDETTIRDTTDAEQRMIDLFEKLRDTVDQIPAPMIERTLELRDFVGPEQFEQALCAAIRGIGVTFAPNDASDFVKMLDLSLSFLQLA
jgi:hypothetical protein